MAVKTIKLGVDKLEVGMFVSSLDRPWVDTPFPLQGFFLINYEDINELRLFCQEVYIDVTLGKCPEHYKADLMVPATVSELKKTVPKDHSGKPRKIPNVAPLRISRGVYNTRIPVKKEILKAQKLHHRLAETFSEFMYKLREGANVDIKEPRKIVNDLVDSVTRNPDAMIWLARVRKWDNYSYHHSIRATIWATICGRHVGLNREGMRALALGTMLCEVGMARIPRELLEKTGAYTVGEEKTIRQHIEHSLDIVNKMEGVSPFARSVVASHHERFDGSGYPKGISGDEIPYLGKIAGIAYAYDELRHPRQATNSITPAAAMNKLYQLRDVGFQSELVDEFIQAVGIYPAGSLVELSTQEIGVIIEQNATLRLSPRVMVMLDANKQPLKRMRLVDIAQKKRWSRKDNVMITACLAPSTYRISLDKIQDILFKNNWAW